MPRSLRRGHRALARSGIRARDCSVCRGAFDAAIERQRAVEPTGTRTLDCSVYRGMHLYRNLLLFERVSGNAFDPEIKFYFVVNAFDDYNNEFYGQIRSLDYA